jgi:hypothetical protein
LLFSLKRFRVKLLVFLKCQCLGLLSVVEGVLALLFEVLENAVFRAVVSVELFLSVALGNGCFFSAIAASSIGLFLSLFLG